VSYHCIGYYPEIKQVVGIPLASPHSWNGQLQGGGHVLASGSLLLLLPCYLLKKCTAIETCLLEGQIKSGWDRGADSALGRGLREAGPWFLGGRAALLACSEL
jgi:hypothetical protein